MYSFFVDFTPQNPGANTQVSAQVTSYNFDVDRSSISWILNGKKAGAGKQFSFTTGNIGSQTVLRVSVTTPDGFSLSQTFYLGAAEVDLLWETPAYVPPVYRGKALAVSQSSVKVAAIPQGFKVSDSSLIYNWNLNGKEMPNLSGKGKNTFNFYTSVAGADVVIGIGLGQIVVTPEGSLESALQEMQNRGIDFVILEGFKSSQYPKIAIGGIDVPNKMCDVEAVNDSTVDHLVSMILSL